MRRLLLLFKRLAQMPDLFINISKNRLIVPIGRSLTQPGYAVPGLCGTAQGLAEIAVFGVNNAQIPNHSAVG